MKHMVYRELEGNSPGYYGLLGISAILVALGLFAAYNMEHHGHAITGMTNQIVWGIPHIFAIFLILAASGVLNVASIGSVFRKTFYSPLASRWFIYFSLRFRTPGPLTGSDDHL
jgi:[DsrC]-trisulfide reductase subunit P